jgi:hypothetical protein
LGCLLAALRGHYLGVKMMVMIGYVAEIFHARRTGGDVWRSPPFGS